MISKHSIESLKQSVDIVDVIGSYVELRKSGSNYVACCPFHNEKTPSFVVSPAKGFYHCYGCNAGGDAFKFLMEYEKLSFIESVEKIASITNFTLEYEQTYQKKPDSIVLDELARFYQKQLSFHKPSLDYLVSRSLTKESIEKFGLGYCGVSFETINFINAKLLDKQEALELGVIGRDGGREYARFSERIIFPIHSPGGKIVGFGGRTMSGANAKYINSPQSKSFNKSKLLYGYHLAKERIYRQKKLIVCEGYLDVIMLHQAGFDYAVATLGTALSKEHLPLLHKGEPSVVLSYDGDKAGINAALRASKILCEAGFDGGVVIFENGKDPADMVADSQIESLNELFAKPKPFVEFVLQQIALGFDLSNPLQKEKALKESIQFLHTLSPVLQEEYKSFLAKTLSLPTHLIKTKGRTPVSPATISGTHTQELSESVLLKSLIENHDFIDFVLEYIDSSLFMHRRVEFELLCAQKYDDPQILAILLNEKIKSIADLPSLKEHLRLFIAQAYSQLLARIPSLSAMSLQDKGALIQEVKTKIMQLKKGELLPYVSSSTF